ncbi:outer membrane beta-barrel protein [Myroides odoratimimus]|uniref:outer membrane beta-barrel protein n=1 Tax=Myroides odoratimimus TaxID=76832 RepID=UPI0025752F54|nr:outer membrane beta-barrel protein [Myroides odoratimimus]MDM1326318.1 TonB-dependent receptor [Myroides odoratimimus]
MKQLLLILLGVISLPSWAQSQLKGVIKDTQANPIGWATVVLQAKDNPKEEYFITSEEDGTFVFTDIKSKGSFKLTASFIGYKDTVSTITINDHTTPINLIIQSDENILDEVMITSHRKALKVTPGKATLNIEQSNLAQTQSTYDVLKTLPGVTISQNGELKIKGKSGVTVLMDGQPTQLSAEQLKTILKGTPGSTLESIEIMNIPPANIDASGTGGVINIISKKKLVQGFYGTVNSTVGISNKVSTDHSLNLGYGNDNWNYNFLYSFSYSPDRLRERYDKKDLASLDHTWSNQSQFSVLNSKSHLVRLDIDRTFQNGHILSLKTSMDYNDTPSTVHTNTALGNNNDLFHSVQKNESKSKLTSFKADVIYKMKIAEKESWTTSIGTMYVKSDINDVIYGNNGQLLLPHALLTKQQNKYPTDRKEFNFKSDYQKQLWDEENTTAKVEFGVKSNYSILKTDERLYTFISNGNDINALHKSQFEYKTGVHAFYGSVDMTFDKWAITAGLRGEYTHINGDTLAHKKLVKQDYFSLFRTVQLTYTASDYYSVMASYSRRIERPEFDKLNPAIRYLNSTTTSMGNPNLQPEYSNNIELDQQFLDFIDLSIGYSRITAPMLYSYFNEGINKSYFTSINGKSRSEWYASLSASIPGINWWENYHGVYFFNTRFDNNLINENKNSVGVFTYNNFKLPYNMNIELTAWYQNRGIESNFRYRSLGEVNLGVSKKFLNEKFTATLAVSDLFKTGGIRTTILEHPDQLTNFTVKNDMRVFKLGITYNFGGKNKKGDVPQEETTINKGHSPVKIIK